MAPTLYPLAGHLERPLRPPEPGLQHGHEKVVGAVQPEGDELAAGGGRGGGRGRGVLLGLQQRVEHLEKCIHRLEGKGRRKK